MRLLFGPTLTCQFSSGHPSAAGDIVEYTVPSTGGKLSAWAGAASHAAPEMSAAATAACFGFEIMMRVLSVDFTSLRVTRG
jgi:hypothetical protein